ncbi:unnamed protein product [Phytophthora fragariaefolia]|uniref:Unnamed protein product n=1 Tax=Phytophthora fragariaefolia TaxID=1490495 RepID=A0A9W6XW76_9STRA|nr:unnamed protein product [Phytophthora fragariaefolia]
MLMQYASGRLQVWVLVLLLSAGLICSSSEVAAVDEIAVDPDVGKNTPEIIAARGYDVETHKVTTSDGYILTMHRLPKSYDESQSGAAAATNKPAVLLQHGIIESSFA